MDISVFYRLTLRLPHEDLNYDDERLLIHFYDTFCNKSIKLFRKTVRYRVKKFIETEDCDEANLIPRLVNGHAYIPFIISSDDMEPTKYYSYPLLQEIVEFLNK